MKNKINSVIIFCFILNSFAVFGSINLYTSKIPLNNSDNLPPIIRLFSVCILPVSMMNNFIVEQTPIASAFKDNSKTHNKNNGNSVLDLFIINMGKTTKFVQRNNETRSILCRQIQTDITYFILTSIKQSQNDWPPGRTNFIYLFILTYLVLLLKSNLPWQYNYYHVNI